MIRKPSPSERPSRPSFVAPSLDGLQAVVKVQCDPSWESVRELNSYVARYVSRRLTATPAERACLVVSELLDSASSVARADSNLDYELLLRPGDLSNFATSISIDTVPERAKLLSTRVHRLMQLPCEEACRTILAAIARGKEDENYLPLARIRSEGMLLDCREIEGCVKITASTP